jgi:glyoxylase-like metal-dependent hydrolase (beta-lactamase superfamily II)
MLFQLRKDLKMKLKIIFSVIVSVMLVLNLASATRAQVKVTNNLLEIGDLKVYMLQDAKFYLPLTSLSGIELNDARKLVNGKDSVMTPANAYLIKTAKHTVLVDAGLGKYPGEDSGHLFEQMKNAGIDPAKIDLVLITHFHFDHIGGLTSSDGKRLFPNAVVRASQAENDFWLQDTSKLPANLRARAVRIRSILEPYISAKSYEPISPDENIGDGIIALPAFGHTPGHTVYAFSSNGLNFWCIGDLIHFEAIQFKNPSVSFVYDSNSSMAVTTRVNYFNRAASDPIILGGAHLPDFIQLQKVDGAFKAVKVK